MQFELDYEKKRQQDLNIDDMKICILNAFVAISKQIVCGKEMNHDD